MNVCSIFSYSVNGQESILIINDLEVGVLNFF